MSDFRFIDFKALDYPDIMPMSQVLSDLLYKGTLNVWDIISPYIDAIEKERHLNFINSMQEESVASIWHDTSETPKIGEYIVLAYKSKVVSSYIYEPKLLAGVWKHAVKWAYVDDLINL